jgi:GTPase
MFVDVVSVKVAAGNGGDGKISFRHEKYVDKGGPDGGDGGNGGDIIFVASRNENTLANFRYHKELIAGHGEPGGKRKKHGKSGKDLFINVPVGTVIIDKEDNSILADLSSDDQQAIIAKGGDGGFGNSHFTSSVRQAPRVAEKGEPGEQKELTLEMRLVADIGLVGFPNAGKSSFLSVISNAKPEIGDFAFTTKVPNLGVVDINNTSILVADIPGLISGASQGKGLGDEFLRHVSRCQVLLHLIDSTSNDIAADYETIRHELKEYSKELSARQHIVVLTKIDLLDGDLVDMQKQLLKKVIKTDYPIFAVSAQAHTGVKELLNYVVEVVQRAYHELAETKNPEEFDTEGLPIIRLAATELPWQVSKKSENSYMVKGSRIEKFAKRTDFDNPHGVARLKDIMNKMGITKELTKKGIKPGDSIIIGKSNDVIKY